MNNPLPGPGMRESNTMGVEGLAVDRSGTPTVEGIPDDRVPNMGQVQTYLMRSSRLENHREKTTFSVSLENGGMRHRGLAVVTNLAA